MTNIRIEDESVTERVRGVSAGALVSAAHFIGSTAVFVLGDESVVFVPLSGESEPVPVHAGAILTSATDGKRIITGGDDGKIVAINAEGQSEVLAQDAKRRWIDCVALGPDGAVAWGAGKQAFVRTAKGVERAVDVPSSVGGLAFAPKGLRLAIAHYGGVSLWFPNAAAAPELLPWKGSHHDIVFSPDGKFLLTTMQDAMLHGWRIADRKDMRMSGYAKRVRSMSWTADGEWLVTSGSDQLILWPFQSKDGPMGKAPRMLAPYKVCATTVAAHPREEVVAAGFEDGLVLLVRLEDGAEIVVKRPSDQPVTALAWDKAGALLAFACEDGEAGVLTL